VNVYDSTTNRVDVNPGDDPAYPYLPTIFRPIFYEGPRDQAGRRQIFIISYSEVTSADLAPGRSNPFIGSVPPHDLSDPQDLYDRGIVQPGHMVYNVPLVVGARKGLPSFDELAVDTQIQGARKLIYHRFGTSTDGPVTEIDPVYLLAVTNVVGVQVWNPYAAAYPRPLQMQVWPDTSVLVTNLETGHLLNAVHQRLPVSPTNYPIITTWPGYNTVAPQSSFLTPLGSPDASYVFMPTNSVYSFVSDCFIVNGAPDRTPGMTNFHVPLFQLTVKTRLRYALVDTVANRLVDYVNLAAIYVTNLPQILMVNPDGSSPCGRTYSPVYSKGGMWCTNLPTSGSADRTMPFGVRMQIDVSRGVGYTGPVDWRDSLPDPIYGADHNQAVDRFLAQFDLGTGFYPKVNTFHAPFQPFRNIHVLTLWQANDPLVHYTVSDLKNARDFPSPYYLDVLPNALPPTPFRTVNSRYGPWGGNPLGGSASTTKYDPTLKDPMAKVSGNPNDWAFPTNQMSGVSWLARVHRGTPWQTVYLKSAATNLSTWVQWTGNDLLVTNLGQLSTGLVPLAGTINDASLTQPTNDWRLASLLVSLLSTNDPRQLLSANQTHLSGWLGALDGMVVLTNNLGDGQVPPASGGFASLLMASNSPQAAMIAAAISSARSSQPHQRFQNPGDLLSTPELSSASPWLNTSSYLQLQFGLSDEAYEAIPSQLLPFLRADSAGWVVEAGGTLEIHFSGADGLAYAVLVSSNLLDWAPLSTNYPVGGSFSLAEVPAPGAGPRFYRSVLLP
jgi:hypothetical protein